MAASVSFVTANMWKYSGIILCALLTMPDIIFTNTIIYSLSMQFIFNHLSTASSLPQISEWGNWNVPQGKFR
jgi:hypothetical protein